MPQVSVIMPNHNCGRFIGQAIESVQAQTYTDWELVICDDGSADNSREVMSRYAQGDTRIVPIYNTVCQGAAQARNNALQRASGRYIAFLDSDDFWYPQKLEHQLRFMTEKSAAMSHSWYDIVNENAIRIDSCKKYKPIISYHDLLGHHRVDCLTLICDKTQTGAFEFTPSPQEDYSLALVLMRRGLSSHCLMESLGSYRLRSQSRSSQKLKNVLDVWKILSKENISWVTRLLGFSDYFFHKAVLHILRYLRRWMNA